MTSADDHRPDEPVLQEIRALVRSKAGLEIVDRDLEKFSDIIHHCLLETGQHDLAGYQELLKRQGLATGNEWQILLDEITVGESYFFRDPGQYELLEHLILPELLKHNRGCQPLRIWCAGCSTGEEAYSIAILLDKLLAKGEMWDVRIVATDINRQALERARKAIYGEWSFRGQTADVIQRYFRRHKGGWRLERHIRDMVSFRYGNLLEDNYPCPGADLNEMDLIICRNVFIYFNGDVIAAVLAKMAYTLRPGGYLITGHSEVYGHQLGPLRARIYPESVIYQRDEETPSPTLPELLPPKLPCQTVPRPRQPSAATARLKKFLAAEPPLTRPSPPPLTPTTAKPAGSTAKPLAAVESWFKEVRSLFRVGRYQAVIEKSQGIVKEQSEHFAAHLLMARAHANMGNYEAAVNAAEEAIRLREFSSAPYYLLAHIAEISEDIDGAKRLLHRAIYLEPSLVAAYLDLAALFEREDNRQKAASLRHTALDLLLDLDPQERIEPYDELTVTELADYVRKLLAGG